MVQLLLRSFFNVLGILGAFADVLGE